MVSRSSGSKTSSVYFNSLVVDNTYCFIPTIIWIMEDNKDTMANAINQNVVLLFLFSCSSKSLWSKMLWIAWLITIAWWRTLSFCCVVCIVTKYAVNAVINAAAKVPNKPVLIATLVVLANNFIFRWLRWVALNQIRTWLFLWGIGWCICGYLWGLLLLGLVCRIC